MTSYLKWRVFVENEYIYVTTTTRFFDRTPRYGSKYNFKCNPPPVSLSLFSLISRPIHTSSLSLPLSHTSLISLLPHRRKHHPVLLDLRLARTPLLARVGDHHGRDVVAAAPPGCFLCIGFRLGEGKGEGKGWREGEGGGSEMSEKGRGGWWE